MKKRKKKMMKFQMIVIIDSDENLEKELTQRIKESEIALKKMKKKLRRMKDKRFLGRKNKNKDEN